MYEFHSPTPALDPQQTHRQLVEAADSAYIGRAGRYCQHGQLLQRLIREIPARISTGPASTAVAPHARRGAGNELVLGPFVGPPCLHPAFPLARVCAGLRQQSQHHASWSQDVHASPAILPVNSASRSELVVPVLRDGAVIAVIDCDSPSPARFTAADAAGIEALAALLSHLASDRFAPPDRPEHGTALTPPLGKRLWRMVKPLLIHQPLRP